MKKTINAYAVIYKGNICYVTGTILAIHKTKDCIVPHPEKKTVKCTITYDTTDLLVKKKGIPNTLDEIRRLLEQPPISNKDAKKYILAEYDRYARLLGFESYEHAKTTFAKQRTITHPEDTK